MTASQVLAKVLEAGGHIIPDPKRPRLLVPAELKPLVTEHRKAIRQIILSGTPSVRRTLRREFPTFPETVVQLLGMRLDAFGREGCPLEVRVPWLEATLWFIPGQADAEALAKEGVTRGRVWTARELLDLMAIPGLTSKQVRTTALAKLEFSGEVVEVRPRARQEGSASLAPEDHTRETG